MTLSTFTIGQSDAGAVKIDLTKFVDTRALIQASSGGGKSWLMRLIAERTAGDVQIIVLDPEGEFATLREKLDLVLVGPGGEIAADIRSAGLLARRLAELRVGAVIDLYDIPGAWDGRRAFVAAFIEALMNVPKASYHQTLIFIDEAHQLCPEAAQARGKDDPVTRSRKAINSLMSAGRKRGFCGILATQRLSKLDKDAAAECKNVFIGSTVLDLDQQRAADVLGIGKADRVQLRALDAGEFYCFGPAIQQKGVTLFRSDQVITTHPRSGDRHTVSVPKASHVIEDLLQHLSDLPREAEQEAHDLAAAQQRVAQLERELKVRPVTTASVIPQAVVQRVEVPALTPAETEMMREIARSVGGSGEILADQGQRLINEAQRMTNAITGLVQRWGQLQIAQRAQAIAVPQVTAAAQRRSAPMVLESNVKLPKAERSILTVLAQYPDGRSLNQVALLAGYAIGTGGFNNAIGSLRTSGYLAGSRERLQITAAGQAALGPIDPLPTGTDLINYWRGKLGKAERAAFDVLIQHYPQDLARNQLAQQAGYTPGTGGINNAISRLCTLELAQRLGGSLKANDTLFLD
jgi:uncharacterized protein